MNNNEFVPVYAMKAYVGVKS